MVKAKLGDLKAGGWFSASSPPGGKGFLNLLHTVGNTYFCWKGSASDGRLSMSGCGRSRRRKPPAVDPLSSKAERYLEDLLVRSFCGKHCPDRQAVSGCLTLYESLKLSEIFPFVKWLF